MNLKSYNVENAQRIRPVNPHIRISGKSGLITFNKGTVDMTGITKKDRIEFFQDEENPKDWYFCTSDKGFPMRETTGNIASRSLCINNVKVARGILEISKAGMCASYLVSKMAMESNGRTLWLIVTTNPLNTR